MEDETLVEVIAYLSNASESVCVAWQPWSATLDERAKLASWVEKLEDLRAGQLRALKPLAAPLKPQEAQ